MSGLSVYWVVIVVTRGAACDFGLNIITFGGGLKLLQDELGGFQVDWGQQY